MIGISLIAMAIHISTLCWHVSMAHHQSISYKYKLVRAVMRDGSKKKPGTKAGLGYRAFRLFIVVTALTPDSYNCFKYREREDD